METPGGTSGCRRMELPALELERDTGANYVATESFNDHEGGRVLGLHFVCKIAHALSQSAGCTSSQRSVSPTESPGCFYTSWFFHRAVLFSHGPDQIVLYREGNLENTVTSMHKISNTSSPLLVCSLRPERRDCRNM